MIRNLLLLLLTAAGVFACQQSTLSADQIMKKVAANQDREQKERINFVYEENLRVAARRTNGKLAREEWTSSMVVPTAKGIEKKRQSIRGRYWHKGRYVDFKGEPVPEAESLDGGLTSGFRDDLTNDKSKDGIGKDLFPLSTEEQKNYKFELTGEQTVSGRKAFRIRFGPSDEDDLAWAGEAIVYEEEFQPISVYSRLSKRIPFFVRTFLGTDLPGLGFTTQYARIDKNVWFPVSFGTEFRLRAVFFINRTITVSLENKNFRRATVDIHVSYDDKPSK